MTYYTFTTLSTVGLGDFHPRSNAERVLCAIILLVGSTMFSYIMGNFIDILYSLKNINVDFKDELMLTKFMGSLTRFNGGQPIDHKRQERIERYFNFRWANDHNIAVSTKQDEELIAQLPSKVQVNIYSDFLFRVFLFKFKKFFMFPMTRFNPKTKREIKHAYFNW